MISCMVTWERNSVENLPHVRSKSVMLTIEAFGRIGSIYRTGEIWAEMKARRERKLMQQVNVSISVSL